MAAHTLAHLETVDLSAVDSTLLAMWLENPGDYTPDDIDLELDD